MASVTRIALLLHIAVLVDSSSNDTALNSTCYDAPVSYVFSANRSRIALNQVPCSPTAPGPSFCCPPDYECRANGLCLFSNSTAVAGFYGMYWRNESWAEDAIWVRAPTCTDRDWTCKCGIHNSECLRPNGTYSHVNEVGFLPVNGCPKSMTKAITSSDWFVSSNKVGACPNAAEEFEFWGPLGAVVRPALTTPEVHIPTWFPNQGESDGSRWNGWQALIAVPTVVGVCFLACCVACCVRCRKGRRKRRAKPPAYESVALTAVKPPSPSHVEDRDRDELPSYENATTQGSAPRYQSAAT